MRTRPITIGRIVCPHYVRRQNAGYAGGILIYWRGRQYFGQTDEYLTWLELLGAVRHRLWLAGLELADEPPRIATAYEPTELRVLVRRSGHKHRPEHLQPRMDTDQHG